MFMSILTDIVQLDLPLKTTKGLSNGRSDESLLTCCINQSIVMYIDLIISIKVPEIDFKRAFPKHHYHDYYVKLVLLVK